MKHDSQPSLEIGQTTVEAEGRSGPATQQNAPPRVLDHAQPGPGPSTSPGFEAMTCPECGSPQVKRVWPLLRMLIGAAVLSPLMFLGSQGKMIFMILVTIWIPCCLVNPSWRCRKCGKDWKPAALTARTPLVRSREPDVRSQNAES
jgi:hypothetical protein